MDDCLTPQPPPEACVENPVMPETPAVPENPMLPRPKRRLPKAPAKAAAACPPKRSLPKAPAKAAAACPPPKAKTGASACGATAKPAGEMWGEFVFQLCGHAFIICTCMPVMFRYACMRIYIYCISLNFRNIMSNLYIFIYIY